MCRRSRRTGFRRSLATATPATTLTRVVGMPRFIFSVFPIVDLLDVQTDLGRRFGCVEPELHVEGLLAPHELK